MEFIRKLLCTVVLFTVNCLACRCVQKPLHEAFCDADFGKDMRFAFIFLAFKFMKQHFYCQILFLVYLTSFNDLLTISSYIEAFVN